jgi:hypothetical protein
MKILRLAAFVSIMALPFAVEAATVSIAQASGGSLTATLGGTGASAWAKVDPSRSTALPKGATWATGPWTMPSTEFPIDPQTSGVSDPCQNACSPFYGGVFKAYDPLVGGAAGWQTTPFWAVFAPTDAKGPFLNQAVMSFARPQTLVSLLWGSPDMSNMVELLMGKTVVGSFWGSEFGYFQGADVIQSPGRSAALLTLSGASFDGLRFSAWMDGGSFEFSNLSTVAAVPLPPAVLMLLAALGTLGVAARRRRA